MTDPTGLTTTFGYTGDGNRSQELFADGTQQAAMYDASGRVKSLSDTLPGGGTVSSQTYSYINTAGSLASNGDTGLRQTMTDASGAKSTYTYDGQDQLTGDKVTSGGSTVHTYAETYDPAGNRLTSTADGTTTSQGYNASDELCWATTTTVSSSSCSSVPTGSHSVFAYDGAGDLTGITHPDSTVTTYGYTGYRQLATQGTVSYTYGGTTQNERYTSTDSAPNGQTNVFTQSLLGLTTAQDTTSGTTTAYTRTPTGDLVSNTTGAGNTQDYLSDALGSVVATVNAASGTTAQTYTYDPTGNLTSSNPGDTNPYRYAGQYQDQTSGTYTIGARTLTTTFGVWTQPDPSGQDANPYAYAGNDPTNNTDPTGDDGCEVAVFGFSTVVGAFGLVAPEFAVPVLLFVGGAGATDVGGGCTEHKNQDDGVSEYGYGN